MNNYDPDKHHRRSIRLKDYDYSQPGAYFLTICTHNQESLFGEIIDAKMVLNIYGKVVFNHWHNLSRFHKYIELGSFVIMPNHIHGIVVIKSNYTKSVKCQSLPRIVNGFKTFSSRRINELRDKSGIPVWQRNYWEHVIRNEESFRRINDYIVTNPLRWHLDRENPNYTGEDDFHKWLDNL